MKLKLHIFGQIAGPRLFYLHLHTHTRVVCVYSMILEFEYLIGSGTPAES